MIIIYIQLSKLLCDSNLTLRIQRQLIANIWMFIRNKTELCTWIPIKTCYIALNSVRRAWFSGLSAQPTAMCAITVSWSSTITVCGWVHALERGIISSSCSSLHFWWYTVFMWWYFVHCQLLTELCRLMMWVQVSVIVGMQLSYLYMSCL